MDKIDHLLMVYQNFLNDESIVREKIQTPGNDYHFVPSLEGTNIVYATYAIYIEENYSKAKECFYRAARVAEFMSNKYDRRIIDSGINPISYALLSDNHELIERYSVLKNTINDDTQIGFQLPNAVQNILQEDWDKLSWNIRCLERFVKFPKLKWYAPVLDVFNGFKEKDGQLIKKGLDELLKTHKKRNKDPLVSKFFSADTSGYNKLAWLKGYEIELGNDFVPKELMPIRPLERYEDYEFLKIK